MIIPIFNAYLNQEECICVLAERNLSLISQGNTFIFFASKRAKWKYAKSGATTLIWRKYPPEADMYPGQGVQ